MASTVSAVSFATSPICMLLVARSETCGMLKGYTLEYGPESRTFSDYEHGYRDGTMVFDVFSATNFETRHLPAYPTDSNCHNRLDDRGGIGIPGCRMDGPQPGPPCLWRRQCYRTPLSDRCIVAVPCAFQPGTIRKTRCADRRSAVVHPCGLCGRGVRTDTSGIQ